jgi:phage-related protein
MFLTEGDDRTWYRVMYLSKIGNVIHVLHCFEKDSRKTIRETSKRQGHGCRRFTRECRNESSNSADSSTP